jgi:hypothetical protein
VSLIVILRTVTNVRTAANLAPEAQQVPGSGQFLIVELTTRFDSSTIDSHRGNGPLTPNPRSVTLVDSRGQNYGPSARAEAVLSALELKSTSLRTPLRPGEGYVSYLVFALPAEAAQFQLQVSATDGEEVLLWGQENSPVHKKVRFSLEPLQGVSSLKSL